MKSPLLANGVSLTSQIAKPRGEEVKQFESAHSTKVLKAASGETFYVKSLSSDLGAANTRRSLPLLNMMRNMAILEALNIRHPNVEINVEAEQLVVYAQEMPNFKTFRQLASEGISPNEALTPENRALYVAAILMVDDLQDQNVGIQNGKDFLIRDMAQPRPVWLRI